GLRPRTPSAPGSRFARSCRRYRLRACDANEPTRLELGLVPLALRRRVPRDRAAGPEVKVPVVEPERADGDVELPALLVSIDSSDRAAVDVTIDRLQLLDVLDRSELRRPGHRTRRKGRRDQVGPAAPRAE